MLHDYKIRAVPSKYKAEIERFIYTETVDEAATADEAERLMKEYGIAFGPDFRVWVEDENGVRISEAPLVDARAFHLRKEKH